MSTGAYSGQVELTWTNKLERLLALDDGTYEWADKADHRIAEVRLLHDASRVGHTNEEADRAKDNLLIRGDALHALTSLVKLPEFANEYRGKVKLVYIDPPFNTGQAFTHYDDNLEHSVWLTMMRDRLVQIQELLAENGSIWLHLDDREVHRARVVLDELFGWDSFVGTVIWEKTDSPRMDAKGFSVRHDSILIYGVTPESAQVNGYPYDPAEQAHYSKVDAEGRPYALDPLRSRGRAASRSARPNLYFPLTDPDGNEVVPRMPDGSDGRWRWGKAKVERDAHLIEWVKGPGGWNPYRRVYPPTTAWRPPETIWTHEEVGSSRTSKAEIKALCPTVDPFDTAKPERLMQRIIEIATDPGDIVLDCFAGSGTTAAVAQKMGRRWVAIERSEATLATFTIPRLTKVVNGEDPGGVTSAEIRIEDPNLPEGLKEGDGRKAASVLRKYLDDGLLTGVGEELKSIQKALRASDRTTLKRDILWEGGGGFRILDVGPSMFVAEDGVIYVADWASSDDLAEPVAAQLGYAYESDPPFCGRRRRARLAVVDGMVTPAVVDLLLDRTTEDEIVVIAATSIGPDTEMHLNARSPGSQMRKIPESILAEYRLNYRRRRRRELNIKDSLAEAP